MLIMSVLVILLSSSCFDPGPRPDMENGVITLRIKNPNFGIKTSAIPAETDSFVVLVKGLASNTSFVMKDTFGDREYIDFNIKLPGGKNYSLYLMGRAKGVVTCFESAKNVFVPAGEITQLRLQMKTIEFSYSIDNSGESIVSFHEPKFGVDSPRNVKWSRIYYHFTFSGPGLGSFFQEAVDSTAPYTSVFTGYEFSNWLGKKYFLRYDSSNFPYYSWYISTETIYPVGGLLEKIDSDTLRSRTPVFFPLVYSSDNAVYEYDWGVLTFYVPARWGGEYVTFRHDIPFSLLSGGLNIIVE